MRQTKAETQYTTQVQSNMDKIALGKKLRQIRRKKRMSHGDLRRASAGFKAPGKKNVVEGVWESYQSRIENGHIEPSISTLEKIAAGLNMPLWGLLLELFCEDNKERAQAIREAKERTQKSLAKCADISNTNVSR